MWKLHRLLESIISDRGPQFIAGLIRELNRILGIKSKLSTVLHPQTDGQTESVNQELEQYLRMFIDYRQYKGIALFLPRNCIMMLWSDLSLFKYY